MFVHWKNTKDAKHNAMCIYWTRQIDLVTLANYTVIGYSRNFALSVWWKLQKRVVAYWLLEEPYKDTK